MGFLRRREARRVAQVAIGVLLVWAALAKLVDIQGMAAQVRNFRLVPEAAANLIGMTVPWIELVAGLALVLGLRARAGAWVATALLLVFTVGVASAIARGLDFECGCFGTADAARVGWRKLLENLGMLALAGIASLRGRTILGDGPSTA